MKDKSRTKPPSRSHGSKEEKDVSPEDTVDRLTRQIEILKEELEEEKEKGKCWEDEKLALENLITVQAGELTENKEQFEEKLAEKNSKYKYYKKECFRLNEELNTLKEKEENTENLQLQLSDREKELVEKNDQIKTIQSEAAKLTAQVEKSEAAVKDLEDSFQRSKAEWFKKISKLEKEKEKLKAKGPNDTIDDSKNQKVMQVDEEKEQLKKKLNKYKVELGEKANKVKELKKEKESKEKIAKLLSGEIQQLKDQLQQRNAEQKSPKTGSAELKILQEKKKEQKQEIESLKSLLKESRQSSERFEGKVKELTESCDKLTRTNGRLEMMMVEVTHVMKNSRTEKKDEDGNDGEEDTKAPAQVTEEETESADADNSKNDLNLSNISDGLELFARSKSFDEELEMTDADSVFKEKKEEEKLPKNVFVTQRANPNSKEDQKKSQKRGRDERDDHHSRGRDRKRRNEDKSCRNSGYRSRDHDGPRYKEDNPRGHRSSSKDSQGKSEFTRIRTSDGRSERYIRYV